MSLLVVLYKAMEVERALVMEKAMALEKGQQDIWSAVM